MPVRDITVTLDAEALKSKGLLSTDDHFCLAEVQGPFL